MKTNKQEPARKDPVCGMVLSPKAAVAQATYHGKTYYFCADLCCEKFEADPEKYLRRHGSS